MAPKSLEKIVDELLPSSIRWMEGKGYVVIDYEDGSRLVKITEKGYEYFAQIQSGRFHKEEKPP